MASGKIAISDASITIIDSYNGYIKFDNGLMLEWGRQSYADGIPANSTAPASISLNESFASTAFFAIATLRTSFPHTRFVSVTSQTTSGIDVTLGNSSATAVTATMYIYWLCIGFWK